VWADALPNLLIGLREGLEAGLVVSILLAAVHRVEPALTARRGAVVAVWWGVAAAVVLALSFGAVLTFYRSVLSPSGQEALGGLLSVVAVVLVTGMVFWMRRTARMLSAQLRAKVGAAMRVSAAALALTAFLAVGREGLETALFLWTTAQASGQTVAPLVGAGVGIAAAVGLCVLLYRSAVRLDLGTFFSRTAVLLIVIAAGVLAYGLGELQDAGWLPGHSWVAFDLTGHLDPGSWWVTLITGVTELSPRMTWLQVVAYVAYLVSVLAVFLVARPGLDTARPAAPAASRPSGSRHRVAVLAGAALVVPPLVAVLLIVFAPGAARPASTPVQVTAASCAPGWSRAGTGTNTFAVANRSGHTVEINLIQAASQGIVAEIETLGPATTQTMPVALPPGGYFFRCLAGGLPTTTSATVQTTGPVPAAVVAPTAPAVKPVALAELQPVAAAYDEYVRPHLATLLAQVGGVRADLVANDVPAAQRDWEAAQLSWEQVGAAYDSFADLGEAIDGLPQAKPAGVNDPGFTGLHRLEYGLWHNQPAAALVPVADQLSSDITTLRAKLPQVTVDPKDMPIRAHEILEDALRDHLNGLTDQGSGAAYPQTDADLAGTRVVLGMLAPLINERAPQLLPTINTQLDQLRQALLATQSAGAWQPVSAVATTARERVNATIGAVLENLALVPDLLEVPAH
jgi:high-affinity iron transporter